MVIKLNITANSRNIPEDLYDELYEYSDGIGISAKSGDDFPIPWDASCYIEGDMFILDGDVGQQGSDKSWAKVGIPLDRVNHYLNLEVYVYNEDNGKIESIFKEYGWI